MTPGIDKLAHCRQRIDAVDVKIVELLNARTEIVHEIGRIKRQFAMPIYEPKREDQVFENVSEDNVIKAGKVERQFGRPGIADDHAVEFASGLRRRFR